MRFRQQGGQCILNLRSKLSSYLSSLSALKNPDVIHSVNILLGGS